jgi:hypothetical protein
MLRFYAYVFNYFVPTAQESSLPDSVQAEINARACSKMEAEAQPVPMTLNSIARVL